MAQIQNWYLYCCIWKVEIDAKSSIFDSLMFLLSFVGDGTDLTSIDSKWVFRYFKNPKRIIIESKA